MKRREILALAGSFLAAVPTLDAKKKKKKDKKNKRRKRNKRQEAAPAPQAEAARAAQSAAPAPAAGGGDRVQTPFGPAARAKEKPAPPPTAASKRTDPMVEAEVSGDQVTFRRRTPFGTQTWTRSRAELSAAEEKLLEESLAARRN